MNYFLKSRLIDRHFAGLQLFDFLRVVIYANNIMSNIGETGAGHEANVAGADDSKIYDWRMLRESAAAQAGHRILRPRDYSRNLVHSPEDVGSKFKSNPNFGNAFSVTVNRMPYSFTPLLSRMTPPKEATQLDRSR